MESIHAYLEIDRWEETSATYSYFDHVVFITAVEWTLAVEDPSFI